MKNILVIGSINADMVMYAPRCAKIGETIGGGNFMVNIGGKGANQAAAIVKLGGCVKHMGCIGKDEYGKKSLEYLKKCKVGTDGIIQKDTYTGVASITVVDGDNSIITASGANELFTRQDIDNNMNLIKWADFIVMQFEIPIDTVLYVAKTAKELGKAVVVNPAPMTDFPVELLKYTDVFTPNEIEAEAFLKMDIRSVEDAKKAIGKLCEKGIENAVITMGSKGCVFNYNNEIIHKEAIPTKTIDTTAAGDTFVGGLTVCLANGEDMKKAVDFATVASSVTVSRVGAIKSIPTKDEVTEKIKSISYI